MFGIRETPFSRADRGILIGKRNQTSAYLIAGNADWLKENGVSYPSARYKVNGWSSCNLDCDNSSKLVYQSILIRLY